jgi:oxygen-dependent protoporphyrinogen oxidase
VSASTDVIVIGGGVTGLTTAHALSIAERPVRLALVEAAGRLGGTIATERHEGFLIDRGPDSFVAQKPEGRALCEALGLGAELVTPASRKVYVRSRGRLRAMPAGMMLGLPTSIPSFLRSDFVSWPGKLRRAADLVLPRGRADEESIASFIGRRFGREAVEVIAEPLLAGIHSGRADELSMSATFPSFVEMERKHRSLIVGLRKMARAAGGRSAPAFYSLRGGMGQLVAALEARLPEGAARLGRRAVRLGRDRRGYLVALDDGSTLSAPVVALCVRSHHAAEIVGGEMPALAEALLEITYASSAVLFYAFDREEIDHPLDATGFVSRAGEGRVAAATFVSSKFGARAPEGKVLLRAFVGGIRDEEILRASEAELHALVLAELRTLLGIRGEPRFRRLFLYERATPQLRVGHAERVARLRAREAAEPGLFIAGGGYEGIGIPECIRQGKSVAARALALLSGGEPGRFPS